MYEIYQQISLLPNEGKQIYNYKQLPNWLFKCHIFLNTTFSKGRRVELNKAIHSEELVSLSV